METMSERLRWARERAKFSSARSAALKMGINPSSYGAHENGQNNFREEDAKLYGKTFSVSWAWLLTGVGTAEPTKDELRQYTEVKRPIHGISRQKGLISEIEARAGAGGGGLVDFVNVADDFGNQISAEIVRDHWQIPDSFLRGELRMEASKALIIEITGDSGYDPSDPHAPGSLMPGDRVIVDARDTKPSPPGPFLVYDGVGLVVKLCDPIHASDPPRIRLSSRNPLYPPYEVSASEGHIVGRVKGRISAM
jgi:hypothetical protein